MNKAEKLREAVKEANEMPEGQLYDNADRAADRIVAAIVRELGITRDTVAMLVHVSEMVEPHDFADQTFNVASGLATLLDASGASDER
jgi:hypothetical protein